jgi:hypothetical protein
MSELDGWIEDDDDMFPDDSKDPTMLPCECPYCHCGAETPGGLACDDCLRGNHQG